MKAVSCVSTIIIHIVVEQKNEHIAVAVVDHVPSFSVAHISVITKDCVCHFLGFIDAHYMLASHKFERKATTIGDFGGLRS